MIVSGRGRGSQTIHRFENGYGASVISDGYGSDEGLYEVGVIQFEGDKWHLSYQTPITGDVLGYLTRPQVDATLAQIEALTERDILAEQVQRKRDKAEDLRKRIAKLELEIAGLES